VRQSFCPAFAALATILDAAEGCFGERRNQNQIIDRKVAAFKTDSARLRIRNQAPHDVVGGRWCSEKKADEHLSIRVNLVGGSVIG
jgi:hypothetical protein